MTDQEAIDEVCGRVASFFRDHADAALFRYGATAEIPLPGVVWDDTPGERPKRLDDDGQVLPWARVTVIDGQSPQRSIGTPGNRLYQPGGVLIIQLFMRRGLGRVPQRELGNKLKDHLRTHRGGVTIRNPSFAPITDREPDSPWLQGNVSADYDFNQLG